MTTSTKYAKITKAKISASAFKKRVLRQKAKIKHAPEDVGTANANNR